MALYRPASDLIFPISRLATWTKKTSQRSLRLLWVFKKGDDSHFTGPAILEVNFCRSRSSRNKCGTVLPSRGHSLAWLPSSSPWEGWEPSCSIEPCPCCLVLKYAPKTQGQLTAFPWAKGYSAKVLHFLLSSSTVLSLLQLLLNDKH